MDRSCTGVHTIGAAVVYRSLSLKGRATDGVCDREQDARPVLLLAGTSISLEDQRGLMQALQESGLEVLSIETPMGGLWHAGMHPRRMRPLCLCDFIEHLKSTRRLQGLDVIAHSYAAYEIVRLLMDAPLHYQALVRSIVLINPPGLVQGVTFASHLLRMAVGLLIMGYGAMALRRCGAAASTREYAGREIRGLNSMIRKGLRNPLRTVRELKDIVQFRLAAPLRVLCGRYGYDFYLFVNSDDPIVPVRHTLKAAGHLLPPDHIRVAPGNHTDLLFHDCRRAEFLSFVRTVRARRRMGAGLGSGKLGSERQAHQYQQ